MKRLKRESLFYGKSTPIIIAIIVDFLISMLSFAVLTSRVENKYKYVFWAVGSFLLVFLTVYIYYKIIHRLTPKEEEKIAMASPPEWKPFPKSMKEHFKYDPKTIRILAVIAFIIELIIIIPIMVDVGFKIGLYIAAVMFPITILNFVKTTIDERTWSYIDETATYTIIDVDHSFTVKEKSKSGTTTSNYIVFYLPDGKYVLFCNSNQGIPKKIIVIKYKNLIRWENVDNFNKYTEYGGL